MAMVDGLAQAYRWSLAECLALTMPQILMLTHAASKNRARFNKKFGKSADEPTAAKSSSTGMYKGKQIDQLSSEEYMEYMST